MTGATRWAPSWSGVAGLSIFVALVVAAFVLALLPTAQRWSGDVPFFQEHAGLVLTGHHDESPFLSWYPPLALAPIGIPLTAGAGAAYVLAFAVEMAAVAAAGAVAVRRAAGSQGGRVVVYGTLVLLTAPLVLWRYDILPAVLVVAAIWASRERRWMLVGVLVGLGAGLKVFPVVLIPLFAGYAWRTDGRPGGARLLGATCVVGLVSLAAYLLFPGSSPLNLLSFTAGRPLQIETVPGSIIAVSTAAGIADASVEFGSFSYNFVGAAAESALGILRAVQPIVLAGVISLGVVAIWRSRHPAMLATAAAATLIALLVTNPVLSSQYMLWVLPLAPLLAGWSRWSLIGAIALTGLLFPWLYDGLLRLDPLPVGVLVARNGLLLTALGALLVQLTAARHPSGTQEGAGEEHGRPVVDPQVGNGTQAGDDRRPDASGSA
jgi:hypothetical protein